jgi:hypothetical protein
MLLVLLEWLGENEVVKIGKTEAKSPQNVVHEVLKRLGGVAQAKGHEEEFK